MTDEKQGQAVSRKAPEAEAFSWLSNPLDWRPIDRFILLGILVMLAPALFGGALLATTLMASGYVDLRIAKVMLLLYAIHAVLLFWFIGMAVHMRKRVSDWPAFENFIIGSFVANVLLSTYVTGTHFTEGLLLLFLGINITSALANIRKIKIAYVVVCVAMAIFTAIDFSRVFTSAPLFLRAPLKPDGTLVTGWLALQVTIAAVLLAISRISMAAVSRWVERENLYREMSTIDGLTRLTNRRSFIERGESQLSRALRTPAASVACVMVDLDHFKRINDTWGHHAGDQVLVAASAILMASARAYDEVGRYGGEEFAILLPGATLEAAVTVAERLREKIAAVDIEVDGQRIAVTASFGVAIYPAPGIDTMSDLLKAADKALYIAKESGRNRVVSAMMVHDEASEPDQGSTSLLAPNGHLQ